jgi:hypothetical protein
MPSMACLLVCLLIQSTAVEQALSSLVLAGSCALLHL